MKINNFRGDLTDISAKKEALIVICCLNVVSLCDIADPYELLYITTPM